MYHASMLTPYVYNLYSDLVGGIAVSYIRECRNWGRSFTLHAFGPIAVMLCGAVPVPQIPKHVYRSATLLGIRVMAGHH